MNLKNANSDSTILIVDDNLDNLRLLSNMLGEKGYRIRRAISGTLALKALEATQFDLILLDITMPDINGYDVCQQLKQDPRFANIPIIFISALNDVIDKVKAFQVGGTDYITKPFQVEEVLARVENQLRIIDLQQELHNVNQQLIKNNQQLQQSNNRYLKNSLVDPVTNFKTKISFIVQLRQNLKQYLNNNNFFALLVIQCDRLKLYSSIFKSYAENQCLTYIGNNIKKYVPDSSILGRINETEFAVFIENINLENIDRVIETIVKIQQQLKLPFTIDEQELFLNPSCGIVIGDRSYQSPEQILCDARHALFYAKTQGHGNYQIFEPEIQRKTIADSELKLNFIKALTEQTLIINYQPIVSLNTQKISGQEAKISWTASGQTITQEKLGYLAAETGFISQLNNYVLSKVCEQIQEYERELANNSTLANKDSEFPIRVSLSSYQFLQSDLATQVEKIIHNFKVDSSQIMLIISEKAFIDNLAIAVRNLINIQQLSIKTSINNFGNLFTLFERHELSIDDLKHDLFIDDLRINASLMKIITNQVEQEFYSAIIAIAHNLGMTVTIENIKSIEQFNSIKNLNCEFVQGTWVSQNFPSKLVKS